MALRPLFPGFGQLPDSSPEVASKRLLGAWITFRADGSKGTFSRFRASAGTKVQQAPGGAPGAERSRAQEAPSGHSWGESTYFWGPVVYSRPSWEPTSAKSTYFSNQRTYFSSPVGYRGPVGGLLGPKLDPKYVFLKPKDVFLGPSGVLEAQLGAYLGQK